MTSRIIRNEADREAFIERLCLWEAPMPWAIEIKPYKPTRSVAQNNLYWMWMGCIRDHLRESTGEIYTSDDVHDWFRDTFLKSRIVEINGQQKKRVMSTTQLSVVDFSEYLEKIDFYCADRLDLRLPRPEDYGKAMGG